MSSSWRVRGGRGDEGRGEGVGGRGGNGLVVESAVPASTWREGEGLE